MSVEVIKPWAKDKLNRRGVAKFLRNYLDGEDDINVLNINAPWGAGKTFFLENWRSELQADRVCVYFNAWQNDFTDDPFIALTAVLHEQLRSECHLQKLSEFKDKASKAIVAAAPAIAKAMVTKISGVDVDKLSEALGETAEKIVEDMIENNRSVIDKIQSFKTALAKLAEEASVTKASKAGVAPSPVYIFIDELDRCRPTYAIELLERIKHFFDVPGCKFVIATDTEQLSCSIRAVYGNGFNSFKYLKRFFDSEFLLDVPDVREWITSRADFNISIQRDAGICVFWTPRSYGSSSRIIHPDPSALLADDPNTPQCHLILLALSRTFRTNMRELEKIVRHIRSIEKNVADLVGIFDFFWAAYLVFLRDEAPEYYELIIRRGSYEKISELKAQYPGAVLYTGRASYTVHEIASSYFPLYQQNKSFIQSKISSLGRDEDPCLSSIVWAFSDPRVASVMNNYPKLAELAFSLQ